MQTAEEPKKTVLIRQEPSGAQHISCAKGGAADKPDGLALIAALGEPKAACADKPALAAATTQGSTREPKEEAKRAAVRVKAEKAK